MNVAAALRRLPPVETAIFLVAAGALVWLAVAQTKLADTAPSLDSFSTYDAASGGYRAYYTLLARLGVRVERFERRPVFLDRGIDTLVYVEPYAFDPRQEELGESDIAALETWVRAGGRLLYIGDDDVAAKRGVLHLPRSTRALRKRHASTLAPDLVRGGATGIAYARTVRWTLRKGTRVLVDDGYGPVVVAYDYGRGSVVATIDESLFENGAIGRTNRARLGYLLAAPVHANGVVSFDEMPHGYLVPARWWDVVPRSFAIAIGLAIAAVLIAIGGAAIRFGPPIVPIERRDRSTADFIDALSALLERGGAFRKASLDAAASTSRTIARAVGASDDAPAEAIARRIERSDQREAYRTMLAVTANGFANGSNLVRGVALAQRLRKEFAAHGRPRN